MQPCKLTVDIHRMKSQHFDDVNTLLFIKPILNLPLLFYFMSGAVYNLCNATRAGSRRHLCYDLIKTISKSVNLVLRRRRTKKGGGQIYRWLLKQQSLKKEAAVSYFYSVCVMY